MAGFENQVMLAKNVNFDHLSNPPHDGIVTANGQLLIGSTANPNIAIVANTLTPGAGITITNGPGTITISASGGGTSVDSFAMQTGTSPVFPDGAGLVTFNGAVVAAGTNPVRTDGTGANTMALEVQISSALAAADANKIGLSNFDSAAFDVDATGFVKTGINRYPITPYVVGPVGFAGYQTIQSALDAANAAGSGAVWVMPGSYTESLTLYPTSQIIGAVGNSDAPLGSAVIITGVHTPPATGFVSFNQVLLSSATDIFNSAVAGSAILILENSTTNCTSGFTFNVPNWTGFLVKFNCQQADVDNGVVNNTGGAPIFFESSNIGQGIGQTMVTSGFVHFNEVDLFCPWNCTTGTILDLDTVTFASTTTFSNDTTGSIRWGSWLTGGSPAITMSSSSAISILGGIVNSSNNPAITGAGAGTLTYENIIFVSNASFAGTLTLATTSWQPYSKAIASTDGTKVGTCAFDSASFSVDANGFVTLSGGTEAIDSIGVDATSGGGTNPVLPTVAGLVTVNGATVAAGTNPIRTVSTAANVYQIQNQISQALAATDANKVGLANFDSARFTVDANGFVSTSGTGIAQTITGDNGGALSPTTGNWNILGRSGSKTSGSGSTLTVNSPPFSQVGSSATSSLNTGEFVTAAVTRTLPASAGLLDGDLFIYVCTTAGALVIQSVSAQKIRIGSLISSAAGTATSTAIGDSVSLRFNATDGFFYAVSVIGTWLLV